MKLWKPRTLGGSSHCCVNGGLIIIILTTCPESPVWDSGARTPLYLAHMWAKINANTPFKSNWTACFGSGSSCEDLCKQMYRNSCTGFMGSWAQQQFATRTGLQNAMSECFRTKDVVFRCAFVSSLRVNSWSGCWWLIATLDKSWSTTPADYTLPDLLKSFSLNRSVCRALIKLVVFKKCFWTYGTITCMHAHSLWKNPKNVFAAHTHTSSWCFVICLWFSRCWSCRNVPCKCAVK